MNNLTKLNKSKLLIDFLVKNNSSLSKRNLFQPSSSLLFSSKSELNLNNSNETNKQSFGLRPTPTTINNNNNNSNVIKRCFSLSSNINSNIFNVQDEDDFNKRVLQSPRPVIVDFHAVWCGPCKILGPRLEKLLASHEGKADFAKVDIDQLSDLAFKYNVQSVPTVIAIKNGKEIGKFVGLIDDDRIKTFVKDAIEK